MADRILKYSILSKDTQVSLLQQKREQLEREVADARRLLVEMWREADDWHGPRASSHYRSDIAAAIRKHGGDV